MNVEKQLSKILGGSTGITNMSIINVDLAYLYQVKKNLTKEPVKYDRN